MFDEDPWNHIKDYKERISLFLKGCFGFSLLFFIINLIIQICIGLHITFEILIYWTIFIGGSATIIIYIGVIKIEVKRLWILCIGIIFNLLITYALRYIQYL